jgi:hypothetical protein
MEQQTLDSHSTQLMIPIQELCNTMSLLKKRKNCIGDSRIDFTARQAIH